VEAAVTWPLMAGAMLIVFMPWLYLSSSIAGPKVSGKGGNSGNWQFRSSNGTPNSAFCEMSYP
jgi:hypothetical protein